VEKEGGKARLLEAARLLIRERPFDEVTIEEIIKQARLSRPAFYYHFAGGKEELRAALVEQGALSQEPVQDVRQEVLKAALHVYARSGISAATLDDIANEAGVTKGALCWHFHSKEDLLTELIRRYSPHSFLRPVVEQLHQDVQAGLPLDDEAVFRRLAEAFYDAFNQQGDYTRLAILLLYTHPEIAQTLTDKIIIGRKGITDYIQKRQAEGYFRREIDPAFLVQVMATTFAMRAVARGLYRQALSNESMPGELPREAQVEQLVSLLLYGAVRRDASPDRQP
jgi:TetR/AcrR family acrAB operon transcriptional repressor